jgi:hypothetical protein
MLYLFIRLASVSHWLFGILLLVTSLSSLWAGEERLRTETYTLKALTLAEIEKLRDVILAPDQRLKLVPDKTDSKRLTLTHPDPAVLSAFVAMLRQVDYPRGCGPTRFIRMESASVEDATRALLERAKIEHPDLTAFPDPRTNRVFITGSDATRDWAEQFLKDYKGEQVGADQPATAPELKSEGIVKPQPESKVRPQ